ncbi:MAG: hypothetical protein RR738_06960 [Anaerorhabdus sp.]|uniref:hypothetical protein n=1 Tax=Anaerorhabdus sp. TaxID=1872524 RepID=UPI002FC82F21
MKKILFLIISSVLCTVQNSTPLLAQQQYKENEYIFEDSSFYNNKLITQIYKDDLFVLNTDTHHLFKISNDNNTTLYVNYLVTNFSISDNTIYIIKEDNTIDFLDVFYSFKKSPIIPDIKNYNRNVEFYNLESNQKLGEFNIKFECDNNGMYLYQISNNDRFDANVMIKSNSIGLGSLVYQGVQDKLILLDFPIFQFSIHENSGYSLINDDSNGKLIHLNSSPSSDINERLNQITSNYIDENVFYFVNSENLVYYLKETHEHPSGSLQGNLYAYNDETGDIKILVEAEINDFTLDNNSIIYSSISNCDVNSTGFTCGLYSFNGKETNILIEKKEILTFRLNNNRIVTISRNGKQTNLELYTDNQYYVIEKY